MKVVVESKVEAHAPDLYSFDRVADGVDGFERFDAGRYRRDGFLVIRNAFDAGAIEAARVALHALASSVEPKCTSISFESGVRELGEDPWSLPAEVRVARVRKLLGFIGASDALRALAYDDDLLAVLAGILGRRALLLQDMALIKPPGGREKPWHQDRAYFNVSPETPLAGVWIAIDDATLENGCLRFVAGGHRHGIRRHVAQRDWQLCDEDVERTHRVAAPMSSGDCVLIDPLIPHGTPCNATSSARWAVQYHYGPIDVEAVPDTERRKLFGGET